MGSSEEMLHLLRGGVGAMRYARSDALDLSFPQADGEGGDSSSRRGGSGSGSGSSHMVSVGMSAARSLLHRIIAVDRWYSRTSLETWHIHIVTRQYILLELVLP